MSDLDPSIERLDSTSAINSSATAAAVLLVISLMIVGAFTPLNGLLYDVAIRVVAQPAQDDVIVVEVDSGMELAEIKWAELSGELLNSGSRAVAFTFLPPEPVSSFESYAHVYLPDSRQDAAAPPASTSDQPQHGAVVIPPSQYGIHRTQLTRIAGPVGSRPTLEAAVAGTTDERPFYVRFPGGIGGIPRVAVEDVLQKRVPDELFSDRIVLIGQAAAGDVGLTTPVGPNEPAMAPLVYHAFALQTLISGSVPRSLPLLAAAALILLSAVLGTIVYLKIPPRHALSIALVVTLIILAFGLLALSAFDTVIPVAELMVVQVLLSLLIWRRREESQDRSLQGLARALTSESLGHSSAGRRDPDGKEHWAADILELSESTVIRLDKRGHFTAAARAKLQELDMPEAVVSGTDPAFEEAARTLAPVQLKSAMMSVVPLSQEGLVAGYWLIRPKDPDSSFWLSSERVVGAFSATIADFALPKQDMTRRPLKERIQQDLLVALNGQRLRLKALEQVLEETSAGLSVRDLLGNELLGTRGFRREMEATGIGADGSIGPADLIGSLAGLDEERSTAALRFVIAESSRISLPVADSGHRHAVLNLSWLEQSDVAGGGFLLFQIVDFSQAAQTAEAQRTASEQLDYMVRNDLEAVGFASAILEHPDLDPQDRKEALARMGQAIDRARQRLLAIEPFLKSQPVIGTDEAHLLSLEEALQDVVVPARQNHKIELDMPDVMAAVIAAPETLRTLLRSALAFLAADARPEAAVVIFVSEETDRTRVELAAADTGVTQERLEAFLTGGREAESQSLRTMIDAAGKVASWGGSFEVHSDAKTNMRMLLTLKKLV